MPVLSLREITEANRAAVEALAVYDEQTDYVAGVAESLVEAAELPDTKPWFRAVYADDEPVGFVMISDGITVDDPEYLGPYYLWRLLIDHRFQAGATAPLRSTSWSRTFAPVPTPECSWSRTWSAPGARPLLRAVRLHAHRRGARGRARPRARPVPLMTTSRLLCLGPHRRTAQGAATTSGTAWRVRRRRAAAPRCRGPHARAPLR